MASSGPGGRRVITTRHRERVGVGCTGAAYPNLADQVAFFTTIKRVSPSRSRISVRSRAAAAHGWPISADMADFLMSEGAAQRAFSPKRRARVFCEDFQLTETALMAAFSDYRGATG